MTKITFCGAAGTVTGSCAVVDTGPVKWLVDCGMFQGTRTTQQLNYEPFPFDVGEIDFVVLTHAHIDHSGLLPKLVRDGYRGPIHATLPTRDLLEFMLPDSAYIQETNAERLNRRRERSGKSPLTPLYTAQDAKRTLRLIVTHDYEAPFEPADGISMRFWNAGHLLGSASIGVKVGTNPDAPPLKLLFSGDLGPDEKAFHPDPDAPSSFDYIVCESTYGGRTREDYTLEKRRELLRDELKRGLGRGGNVVIPSFAVERSQELLHDIAVLLNAGEIPNATVYLDSPLAHKVTEVFIRHAGALHELAVRESELFRHPNFRLVETVDESIAINRVKSGAIIISASGMCTAGRIKHHLKNNIWRDESSVLFVGYQAPGTLGHILANGAKDVRIYGKQYRVRAAIRRLGNYSAHADQDELADWITERGPVSGGLFLNHGEDDAREALRDELVRRGIASESIHLPGFDQSFELVGDHAGPAGPSRPRVDPESLRHDWFNDYAAFILELQNRVESLDDSRARGALIRRLAATLESATPGETATPGDASVGDEADAR